MESSLRSRVGCAVAIAFLLLICVIATSVSAQVVGAILSGTVTDSTGAAVPGAQVTATSADTGITRSVLTNDSGFYNIPNLAPGTYSISISAAGFARVGNPGLTLTVGEKEAFNVQLQLAKVAQQVEVTAAAPAIELASSEISDVVDGTTTRELPLNGRDWTQLATLQPGIANIRTQPSATGLNNRGNRGFGTQLTINGARPQQNNYRIDGISVNDYANSAPGSTLGLSLGVDAIQEFSVISSNYSASYGLTSGGVINASTKAGTNAFHGTAYEFLRNDKLDARNYIDTIRPPFKRNQFGAALGGPIVRNHTFFFVDYEGLRQVLSLTNIVTVPSNNARNGIMTISKMPITVSPAVKPYLPLWHVPDPGTEQGDVGTYTFVGKSYTPENFVTGRVDQRFSDRDSAHATYLFDSATTSLPDNLNVLTNSNSTRRQTVSVEENHIFSAAFANAVRVGLNRVVAQTLDTSPGANPLGTDQSLGAGPGLYAPQIQVGSGITPFQGGLNGTSFANYGFTTPQLYDDAFVTRGRHALKFGFAFERILSNMTLTASPDGIFRFNTLSDFLQNKPLSFQIQLGGASPRGLRQSAYGGYIEDDVRVLPNLTINAGVRYEPASVPTETHGRIANLRTLSSPQVFTGDPYFNNPTVRNVEPRVGFAWDPFKTGKTALRAGFGVFDMLPLIYQFNLMDSFSAPFFLFPTVSSLPLGSFPTGALPLIKVGSGLRADFVDFNPPRSYVMQWNFNVQQQLAPSMTMMIGYVGSHGVHLPYRTTDANAVQPTLTPAGYLWPCGGAIVNGICSKPGTGIKINPNFGQIDGQIFTADSVYDGLLFSIKKAMARGLQVQTSFTWSKSLDTSSSVIAGGPFQNSISGSLFAVPFRGPSDFNIGRNLVINGLWRLPGQYSNRLLRGVASGWELGGIFQVSDGLPFTPQISGDALGLTTTSTIDLPNRITTGSCATAVNPGNFTAYLKTQCFTFPNPSTLLGNAGRNSLVGPGLLDLDFSLYKDFPLGFISEASKLQFRSEFFNATNHTDFEPPISNNKLFDAKGNPIAVAGRLDTMAIPARQIQFGLKLIW
jgi:hypothetical protein